MITNIVIVLLVIYNVALTVRYYKLEKDIEEAGITAMHILKGVDDGDIEQIIYRRRRFTQDELNEMETTTNRDE